VFDTPTEINSAYEGRFMERIAPGAFMRTLAKQGDKVKVLYDHGQDPSIGNKPLGVVRSLREDTVGVAYEVGLFDNTSYVADLLPGLRAGAYGSSFRFRVVDDTIDDESVVTDWNPNGLPVRTVTDVDLYEFGPVTFPAYPDATAGVRSLTDTFADRLLRDPLFLARFTERAGTKGREFIETLRELPAAPQPEEEEEEEVRAASGSADEGNDSKTRRMAAHQQATDGFLSSLSRFKEHRNA
jgi:HK97 family phage prohead protease